jgi:predicted SAM-dependent methyltransferase
LEWNILEGVPLPVENNSVELCYSSHVLEYLTNDQAIFLVREALRILKPGGILRITCRDIERHYVAFRMRDVFVNNLYGHLHPFGEEGKNTYSRERMVIWLVNEFASQLVQSVAPGHAPIFGEKVQELEAIFESLPLDQACDRLCGLVDLDLHRRESSHPINWWTYEKLRQALRSAGLSQVVTSVPGGSVAAVMRNTSYFDKTSPELSLFVDAVK